MLPSVPIYQDFHVSFLIMNAQSRPGTTREGPDTKQVSGPSG